MEPSHRRIRLHPHDNVEVAVADEDPLRGHKFAVSPIDKGEPILKLGEQIGRASTDITIGDHVHSHNVEPARRPVTADDAATNLAPRADIGSNVERTFNGYHRPDGRVGTRNHLLVLTSVNCSASVARVIARTARDRGVADRADVDGLTALTHHGGCGIGVASDGLENLRRTLAGYATNANVGGVLLVGLGCEVNQIDVLLERHCLATGDRLQTLVIQDEGGASATIDRGVELLGRLAEQAATDRRTPAPIAKLALALQCGGSDGYSAITANPALGRAADLLVAHGATVILGETPEMHGAEHLLVRRATTREVAQSLLDRLEWWRAYSEPEDNPTPGNKKGGLTTIAEKSLGAVAKAGTSPLVDVLRYAEPLRADRPGFVIMDSPGYDPCSVTGEIASGANLVCFTTGRGSVSGFVPAPSVKVSTNTPLFEKMAGDIDLDAGTIATGRETVDEVGERLFDLLVDTADGRTTAGERLGFGEEEFVPWQMGVVT
jgi:altronate dehydratase